MGRRRFQEGKPEMKPHGCSVVWDLPSPGHSWNLSLQAPASLPSRSALPCFTHWCSAYDFVRSKDLCLIHARGFQKRIVKPREMVQPIQGHPAGKSRTETWVSQAMPTSSSSLHARILSHLLRADCVLTWQQGVQPALPDGLCACHHAPPEPK